MKSGSDKFTFVKQTSPECFRAVATGVGPTIGGSKASGEVRKELVRRRPGTIALAPANEGFGAEKENYPEQGNWYGVGLPSSLDSSAAK